MAANPIKIHLIWDPKISGRHAATSVDRRIKLTMDRRQLGKMVIDEPDEILKIIAAHLMCILQASGTPLEFLWPEKTDKAYYEGFPPATQDNTGWGQAFQNYVDDLYEKVKGPAA